MLGPPFFRDFDTAVTARRELEAALAAYQFTDTPAQGSRPFLMCGYLVKQVRVIRIDGPGLETLDQQKLTGKLVFEGGGKTLMTIELGPGLAANDGQATKFMGQAETTRMDLLFDGKPLLVTGLAGGGGVDVRAVNPPWATAGKTLQYTQQFGRPDSFDVKLDWRLTRVRRPRDPNHLGRFSNDGMFDWNVAISPVQDVLQPHLAERLSGSIAFTINDIPVTIALAKGLTGSTQVTRPRHTPELLTIKDVVISLVLDGVAIGSRGFIRHEIVKLEPDELGAELQFRQTAVPGGEFVVQLVVDYLFMNAEWSFQEGFRIPPNPPPLTF